MTRDQVVIEIARLFAERQRIDAELDQILGRVSPRRGRPPGSRSTARAAWVSAPKRRGTRMKRGLSKGSLAFKIVEVLKRSAKTLNARTVAAAIGEKRVPMVSSTMNRLKTTGYLKRAGRGKYRAG